MSLVEQLINFHRVEWFQKGYERTDNQLKHYFETMLDKGRMILCIEAGEILGYAESYRLNFEQLGRLVCGEDILVDKEDIETGSIAYLANTDIEPEHRNGPVVKHLKEEFFKQNEDCLYFCGFAERKKHRPWKVFKRKDLKGVIPDVI